MRQRSGMSRRELLKRSGMLAAAPLLSYTSPSAAEDPHIVEVELTAKESVQNLAGPDYPDTRLWLYNDQLGGPVLRARKGDLLRVHFRNELSVPSSIHWHGVRNVNAMDGVAGLTQDPVPPGGTFTYAVPLKDSGTYWYHAHTMAWEQVARGLYGPLIVQGEDDVEVDQELVLILDDWRLDDQAQLDESSFRSMHDWSHTGRLGNQFTVNGQLQPQLPISSGSRLRLRLINAANARILHLKLEGAQGTVIALDGLPCEPFPLGEQGQNLAPAQRVDLLVDAGPRGFQLQEVSTRQRMTAASFVPDETTRFSFPRPALQLPSVPLPEQSLKQARRIPLHMQGGAMGNLREVSYQGETLSLQEAAQQYRKLWAFNGEMMQATSRIANLKLGEWVGLELWNDTAWPHAMHLHGHHFWIEQEGQVLSQKRDTYLMKPGEKANLFFVADNPGLWLFHCHMLEHHASGMGGVFSIS